MASSSILSGELGWLRTVEQIDVKLTTPSAKRAGVQPLHIIVRGDSLTLPRPERYDPPGLPLVTTNQQTFPWLIAMALGAQVWNQSRRGMTIDEFEDGLGLGLVEMVNSLEPDAFIASFGYAEVWRLSSVDEVSTMAERYVASMTELAKRRPSMVVVMTGLPLVPSKLLKRFPDINDRLSRFNQTLDASGRYVPAAEDLHTDGQHFSVAGHRIIADRLVSHLGEADPRFRRG